MADNAQPMLAPAAFR
jgi:hypothetical protein